jgi:Transposase and inactivated derivatives
MVKNLIKELEERMVELFENDLNEEITENIDFESTISTILINKEAKCPRCFSKDISKNGKTKALRQRYICKACGKSFSEMTGTTVSYSKKELEQWAKYTYYMSKGMTLRKISKILKISLVTSFQWRHKILSSVEHRIKDGEFSKVVQIDELRMKENFKGNHSRNKNFKVLSDSYIVDDEIFRRSFISVLNCRDLLDNKYLKAVSKGYISREVIDKHLGSKMNDVKIIGVCRNLLYVNFAKENNLKICMDGSTKYNVKNVDINLVRTQGRLFKKFIRGFRGVATKYISFYINWFRMIIDKYNIHKVLLDSCIIGRRKLINMGFKYINFNGVNEI